MRAGEIHLWERCEQKISAKAAVVAACLTIAGIGGYKGIKAIVVARW